MEILKDRLRIEGRQRARNRLRQFCYRPRPIALVRPVTRPVGLTQIAD
jgi:hypothetical protein